MLRKSVPLLQRLGSPGNQVRNVSRAVWDLVRPSSEMRSLVREMDRQMDAFERDFFRNSPFRFITPRRIPVEGVPDETKKFQVSVNVSGFSPEDIKLSLNEGVLRIEAKMEKTGEDGSKMQQQLVREFSVPSNVDLSSLESHLHTDGTLVIAAARNDAQKIPIEKGTDSPAIDKK